LLKVLPKNLLVSFKQRLLKELSAEQCFWAVVGNVSNLPPLPLKLITYAHISATQREEILRETGTNFSDKKAAWSSLSYSCSLEPPVSLKKMREQLESVKINAETRGRCNQ
jgi:hypothetical protein